MLIDLRNTPYYLSKHFSIKQDLFGSDKKDLKKEDKEKIANLNMVTAASAIPVASGVGLYLYGRDTEKFHKKTLKEKDPLRRTILDGSAQKRLGLKLAGIGLATGTLAQIVKHRVNKRIDEELEEKRRKKAAKEFLKGVRDREKEEEKKFAAPATSLTKIKPKNVAQVTQNQMAQQRAAQTNQLESGRNTRAAQVQQRFTAENQQRNMLEAGRNNRLNQKLGVQQQSNILRAKEIAQKNSGQANPGLYKPNVGPPPVVSMN